MQREVTSWPQFCKYSGLQIALGADGSGDARVRQERSQHWGHLSVQDFCTGLWTLVAQPGRYLVIGTRTIRIVLQDLSHRGCKWWNSAFGLAGAFAFWAHWGLRGWSGAATWERTWIAWKRLRPGTVCCLFPPRENQFKLETKQASSTATWARWKAGGRGSHRRETGQGWQRRLFVEEVENNSVSVPHRLQGGWSRAELANSCRKPSWDSGELEQALARIAFVVYGVCSLGSRSCSFREIRGQRRSPATCSLEVFAAAFLLWRLWLNFASKLSAIGQDFCLSAASQIFAAARAPGSRGFALPHWLFQSTKM